MNINEIYVGACSRPSDIHEHLPTLSKYSAYCDTVVELGVRWVCSTWGLLHGRPRKMLSFDIGNIGSMKDEVQAVAKEAGVDWDFINENVLATDKIPECDVLFIDTLHAFEQLATELWLHGNKARKFIIMHDTVAYGLHDEGQPQKANLPENVTNYMKSLPKHKGLIAAINLFLEENEHWQIKEVFKNNNGLIILERV